MIAIPSISSELPVAFRPISTPNFVRTEEREHMPEISCPLKDIPDEAFHRLVRVWVNEIYEKAGKHQPPQVETRG